MKEPATSEMFGLRESCDIVLVKHKLDGEHGVMATATQEQEMTSNQLEQHGSSSTTDAIIRLARKQREQRFEPGDVVEDEYGNPAVVLHVVAEGRFAGLPAMIMQTVDSDRGRRTYGPRRPVRVDGERADWAREVARAEWRAGRRW